MMPSPPLRVSLPPDPNTRPPRWKLPPGACDTHAHIFGPPDVFPYSEERRYTPPAAPVDHYKNVQSTTGLSRVVFVTPTAHGVDNRVILHAISELGDSARGIASIDRSLRDNEIDELNEGGIRGARFHLMDDRAGNVEFLNDHLDLLQTREWILDLHVDPQDLIDHERFIRNLPVVTIIDQASSRPDRSSARKTGKSDGPTAKKAVVSRSQTR